MPPTKPAKPKETRTDVVAEIQRFFANTDTSTALDTVLAYFTTVDLVLIRDECRSVYTAINTNITNAPPRVTP